MQEFFGFFAAVVVISASGVMAPGPLFAATIASGIKEGKLAGLKVAVGHTVVEFLLVILIGIGVLSLEVLPEFRVVIGVLGALSIFAFASLQLHSTLKKQGHVQKESKYSSFLTGILLTGLNPFFLIWWFTIGFKLIADAFSLWSFLGILIMFGLHIWMDYVWLFFVSALSSKGTKFLTNKGYKFCMIAINVVLIYFGISFITNLS
ncbi:MAG TPA: LysE family transporter [Candidatus Nitrosotenuis sp.]|jgi:threonine/homoserine/homoserine lactone efflux protein